MLIKESFQYVPNLKDEISRTFGGTSSNGDRISQRRNSAGDNGGMRSNSKFMSNSAIFHLSNLNGSNGFVTVCLKRTLLCTPLAMSLKQEFREKS
ncbi:MAG: hypothetical protein V7K77_01735 [Nostoc sp.]|uniref:hypothetical protein n=1 Tax=Nostoc sp. TaxID=1180 RepID=UPI002FFBCC71